MAEANLTEEHEIESVAYDTSEKPYRGFTVRASYLKAPRQQDALIEMFRDGKRWNCFYYPAYRIYNIVAHFNESVDAKLEEEAENPSAHVAAGVTGHD